MICPKLLIHIIRIEFHCYLGPKQFNVHASKGLTVARLWLAGYWTTVAVRTAVAEQAFPGASVGKACSHSGPEMVAQDLRRWLERTASVSILSLLIPTRRCLDKRSFRYAASPFPPRPGSPRSYPRTYPTPRKRVRRQQRRSQFHRWR